MLKAFLFDLDGTIWDSKKAICMALKQVIFKQKDENPQEKTLIKRLDEESPIQILNSYRLRDYSLFWKEYKTNYNLLNIFFKDTALVLKEMLHRRKKLGVVTSLKKKVATEMLDKFDLSSLFSVVVTPSDTSDRKPSPKPLLIAMDRLRVDAKETIYIGDQEIDIVAAARAGCYSGLAQWGKRSVSKSADFTLNKISDVLTISEA
jgi:pyrophosphatase PpaX